MTAVHKWFSSRGWTPFPFQEEVWQAYAAGESGLVHAATGTGKTYAVWMAALLQALNSPSSATSPAAKGKRKIPAASFRVLWLTPLRALAKDTAKALEEPLADLGLDWTVETRTSDTSASARSRQRRRLPTALITTPESFSLLLTREDPKELFASVQLVVVDEWHELAASKRGVQVELGLARLRTWRPDLCVWGLSATIGNLDLALATLLGAAPVVVGGPSPRRRLVRGLTPKTLTVDALIPEEIERFPWSGHLGARQTPRVVEEVGRSASSLLFTNTRSQAEYWHRALVEARPDWADTVALHHGSIDRAERERVEEGLRAGSLRCVVCTSSLDLGVDFSPVERVLQISSPKGIGRLIQRAGRSGHQPNSPSRITCVPTNAFELVEIAAAREALAAGRIESREGPSKPIDVLVQHLVTAALGGGFTNALLDEVRTTASYADLTDDEWRWAVDFVAEGGKALGAYPDFHRVVNRDGVYRVENAKLAMRHRMSIGTISDSAAIQVRYLRGQRLGTIEEGFAARLRAGDRFLFAGKPLEFVRIYEMTVWVKKAKSVDGRTARWMGGRMPLSTELAAAVRRKLEEARQGVFHGPEMSAVRPVLALQAERSILPAANELLIERLTTREGRHLFFYPFEGRLVHEGLAALLATRLGRIKPLTFTIAVNDYGLELLSADPAPIEEALRQGLFASAGLVEDVHASLNAGELARRKFREIARVAGLVFPGGPGAAKSVKQLQASSGLFFDVFNNYDPENLLLRQADQEVLEQQLQRSRLGRTLERLTSSVTRLIDVSRPTPLAFPLLVERFREQMSFEKLADRIQKLQMTLERPERQVSAAAGR